MNKENTKSEVIINVELNGMNEIQDQVKDLKKQLDTIINKFEKIAELSKSEIKITPDGVFSKVVDGEIVVEHKVTAEGYISSISHTKDFVKEPITYGINH